MSFIRITFFSLIIFCSASFASPLIINRLQSAKSGDYIVFEANKMLSLLIIRSLTPHSLILEEISIPSHLLNPRPPWQEWVQRRAPGHTSWSMIEIDLETCQLIECYSFSRSAWIETALQDSPIATLLTLSLQRLPEQELRRIGPPPQDGEPDRRKVWLPPLIVNGVHHPAIEFDIYKAVWPYDDSELSGNTVSLYFDRQNLSPFPVWIQVETTHLAASLRVIDSGKELPILHKHFPRRIPEFIGIPQKTQQGIRLSLKSPRYYRHFELFAVDVTTRDKQMHPIAHSLSNGDGELLQIEVDQSELEHVLEPDHRYTWLIVPKGQTEFYSESNKSFLWKAED